MPSVVYGFFGLVVIVPFIDRAFGGGGNSLLAAILILSIMILPTIINLSETAIRAVPSYYREGSLGLGATQIETIFRGHSSCCKIRDTGIDSTRNRKSCR